MSPQRLSLQGPSSVTAKGAYANVTEELFVLTFVALATWCPAACRGASNIRIPQQGGRGGGVVCGTIAPFGGVAACRSLGPASFAPPSRAYGTGDTNHVVPVRVDG